jgi:hypothetical protein
MARTSAITVTSNVPTFTYQRTLVLTGTNKTSIATIVVTGVPAAVIQSTSTNWRAEIRLSSGTNTLQVSGLDQAGNTSETLAFTVLLPSLQQESFRSRNVFDNFGDLLALPRLPGEKNLPYLNRLRDVMVHPTATTLRGVTFGAARDLGIQVREALSIRSPLDPDTQRSRAIDGTVIVGQVFFDVRSIRFQTTDCVRIEPATQEAVLSRRPVDKSAMVLSFFEGDVIDPSLYEVDFRNLRVRFLTHRFNGQEIKISYLYLERIPLRTNTLGTLKTALEALAGPDGIPLFAVTLFLPTATAAENLLPQDPITLGEFDVILESCPLRVRELLNPDFQEIELNADGHAIDTKLEQWARRINMEARVIWDSAFLGESVWEPLGETPRLGVLPHLTNPQRGHWECLDPTDGTRFTLKDFRAHNGLCPLDGTPLEYHGILPLQFQSGTGTRDDLFVKEIITVQTEG